MLPHKLFELFVEPLNRHNVEYMATGSVASIVYGEPRMTTDIDLVITLSDKDAPRFHSAFDESKFYVPPIEVINIEARRKSHGHFNIIHHETGFRADVYLAGNDELQRWGLERRQKEVVDGQTLWLAPPEYVILYKLKFRREGGSVKHVSDIQGMLRMFGERIDYKTLEGMIDRFRLRPEWNEVV